MSKGLTLLASRLEEAEQQAAMALAKAQPGKLSYASAGTGTARVSAARS